jgi:hypothetical protein
VINIIGGVVSLYAGLTVPFFPLGWLCLGLAAANFAVVGYSMSRSARDTHNR